MKSSTSSKLTGWEIKPSTGNHFAVLDGLRGIAILFVVIYHTFYFNPEHGVIARGMGHILKMGGIGVPIFFVLSGFLISFPFFQMKAKDVRYWYQNGYFKRRVGKIIPPFYLSIILIVMFFWLVFHDGSYFNPAWKWALGLGNFMTINPKYPLPIGAWSLRRNFI